MSEVREQEATRSIVRVRMDIVTSLNAIIEDLNTAIANVEQARSGDIDISDVLPSSLQIVDVKFKIIVGYLEEIAQRALVLGDAKLLDLCEDLGLVVTPKKGVIN